MKTKVKAIAAIALMLMLLASLIGCGSPAATQTIAPVGDATPDGAATASPPPIEDNPTEPVNNADTEEPDTSAPAGTVSWKQWLQEYEEWVDSYVDFMKRYDPSDLSMLTEYMELLEKMGEWAEKADEVADSVALEDLAEWMAAYTRIIAKLSEI